MEQEGRHYFRLGLFVAVSLCVLAAGLFLLGGRKLFQPTFTFETYFDKSVAGLDLGAPVRFRGVPLGQVSEIVTSSAAYEKDVPLEKRKEYIVVRAKVNLSAQQTEQMERDAAQFVKRGLRAQTQLAGVTGQQYLMLSSKDYAALRAAVRITDDTGATPRAMVLTPAQSTLDSIEASRSHVNGDAI